MAKQISKEAAQRGAAIYSRAAETGVLEDLDRAELEYISTGVVGVPEGAMRRGDFDRLNAVEKANHIRVAREAGVAQPVVD